jgi:hypothetical protein
MKIEIKDQTIETREGKNEDGTPWVVNSQSALFHRGDGAVFPVKLKVEGGKSFPIGMHDLALDSFVPGRFGKVEFFPRPDVKQTAVKAVPTTQKAGAA